MILERKTRQTKYLIKLSNITITIIVYFFYYLFIQLGVSSNTNSLL